MYKRIQWNFCDKINCNWCIPTFLLLKGINNPLILQYGKKAPTCTNLNVTSNIHHRTQLQLVEEQKMLNMHIKVDTQNIFIWGPNKAVISQK